MALLWLQYLFQYLTSVIWFSSTAIGMPALLFYAIQQLNIHQKSLMLNNSLKDQSCIVEAKLRNGSNAAVIAKGA